MIAVLLAFSSIGCLADASHVALKGENFWKGGLFGGMLLVWNSLADTLGSAGYVILPKYEGAGEGTGVFLLFSGVVLALFDYAMLRSRQIWLLLFYAVPFFGIQILWDIRPSVILSVCFLAALCAAAAYCLHPEGMRLLPVIILTSTIGVCSVAGWCAAGESYVRPYSIRQAGDALLEKMQDIRYGRNVKGDGSLKPEKAKEDKAALEITMEQPDSYYLKGFVGSVYSQGRWEHLDEDDYYEKESLYYWLRKSGFSGMTQLASGERLSKDGQKTAGITVSNINASRKYFYVPYELSAITEKNVKNWGDSFLTSDSFRGTGDYTFEAAGNIVKDWPELAANRYLQRENPAFQNYYLNESYYNVDNYEWYVQLTDSQKDMVSDCIGTTAVQTEEHLDYKEAIGIIRACLEKTFQYTEDMKESTDPLETFFEERKGCDVHYASAATLMFRYFGIPARYVEGYIVTPENAKDKQPGETIEIPESNNHAWTEIYIDGFGWVPLEVTPEYYTRMEQPDLTKGLQNVNATHTKTDTSQQQQNQTLRSTEPANDDRKNEIPWRLILIIAGGILLFILLLYLLIRVLRRCAAERRRKKSFRDPDVKRAVCAVYEYMMDKKFPLSAGVRSVGDRAAFSTHEMKEEDRQYMLKELERIKRDHRRKGR